MQTLQRRLHAAENGESPEAFEQVAAELLSVLTATPIDQVQRGAHRLQLLLLERLVADMLESRPALAVALCRLGQERASSVKAEFWRRWFTLLGVQGCIGLLDFVNAISVLVEELGLSFELPLAARAESWAEACEQFASVLAPVGTRAELHVLALTTVARWSAAVGQLALANRLLTTAHSRALVLGNHAALEVAIRLGEIQLDQGDFAGFDDLESRVLEQRIDQDDPTRWSLLRAHARRASGRLTEARVAFGRLGQQTRPEAGASPSKVHVECLLQEADLLITLNRIDEAEQTIDALRLLDARAERKAAEFRARIDERAGNGEASVAPIAILRPLFGSQAASAMDLDVEASHRREAERLHDDICRGLNAVVELLRRGESTSARSLLGVMREWADACDSILIRGRVELVEAIGHQVGGQRDHARACCARALEAFDALGARELRWIALRIEGWTLATNGTSQKLDENRRQQEHALHEFHEWMSAEDRVYHMLSRWTQVDLQTRAVLDGLSNDHGPPTTSKIETTLAWIEHTRTWSHLLRDNENDNAKSIERTSVGLPALIRRRSRANAITGTRGRWLPARTAILRYLALPDGLEGILQWRSGHHRLRAGSTHGRPEVRKRLARFLKYTHRSTTWRPDAPWVSDLSAMLGLEEIFEVLPPRIERLAVVPDGLMYQVPYALLQLDGVSLLDRFVPLVVARHSSTWMPPGRFRLDRLPMTLVGLEHTSPSMGLEPLDGVHDELAALTANGRTVTRLVDGSATRLTTQQRLRRDAIIHFACHGRFDPTHPTTSGLALHDGWMTIADLMAMTSGSPASLVSMSACWGANMSFLPGQEIVSVPTALLDLGVEWVIASLLPVQDRQNPRVMKMFYDALSGSDPAEALAVAQRACMNDGMPGREWGCYVALRDSIPVRRGFRWWARFRARHWPLYRDPSQGQ